MKKYSISKSVFVSDSEGKREEVPSLEGKSPSDATDDGSRKKLFLVGGGVILVSLIVFFATRGFRNEEQAYSENPSMAMDVTLPSAVDTDAYAGQAEEESLVADSSGGGDFVDPRYESDDAVDEVAGGFEIGTYVTNGLDDERAYFYKEPNESTRTRAYLMSGIPLRSCRSSTDSVL